MLLTREEAAELLEVVVHAGLMHPTHVSSGISGSLCNAAWTGKRQSKLSSQTYCTIVCQSDHAPRQMILLHLV